jgi:hypothetical protein
MSQTSRTDVCATRAGGAERFDPSRVEKLGWRAIRGRRAQKPAPLPTATHLEPLRGSDEKAGYIDLGPVRAGLVKRAEEWQWSSVHDCTGGLSASLRPNRTLTIDRLLLPADEGV